jgi:hypothetical protein
MLGQLAMYAGTAGCLQIVFVVIGGLVLLATYAFKRTPQHSPHFVK